MKMNSIYWCVVMVLTLTMPTQAQTQQGMVKTRGRMVNGKYVPGKGLSGATVRVQGRSAVVSRQDGAFSFPIPAQRFQVQSVTKQGYQLLDEDATRKSYAYSANPIYLVMETPEQLMDDLLDAQERISKTLREQLKKARVEIQQLKDENHITEEEYSQRIAKLMESQQNNQKLISDMAQEYATLDYDQMDEQNQRISDAILNGRLTEADSLLRSKGDLRSRIASIRIEQQAEAEEESELTIRQGKLIVSKAATQKKLEDAASDCYNFFNRFKLENLLDSAAYYMEMRAAIDTANAQWQFQAGYFSVDRKKSISYYQKVIALTQDSKVMDDLFLNSTAKLNIGAVKASMLEKNEETELFIKEGIQGRKKYAEQSSNPNDWNHVAWALITLGDYFINTNRFEESDSCLREAKTIYQKISSTYFRGNEYSYARLYDTWGWLCLQRGNLFGADSCYLKAWKLYAMDVRNPNPQKYGLSAMKHILHWGFSRLYKTLHREDEIVRLYSELKELYLAYLPVNRPKLEPEYASMLVDFGLVFFNTQHFTESEAMFKEALEIYRCLAKANPQVYEPEVARTLNNLAILYQDPQHYAESEAMYKEALEIRRRLAQANPQAYEPAVAQNLGDFSFLKIFVKQYAESEQLAREGLSVDSTQNFIYTNLAAALLFQGKYAEAEKIYRQYKSELKDGFLEDFRQFAEAGVIPKEREADVERIKKMLNEE